MKLSKPIAGYHLLLLLLTADGKVKPAEALVIKDWLASQFPFNVDLDAELEKFLALKTEEHMSFFNRMMDEFYLDSTVEERNEFLRFALELVKADKNISPDENVYLNLLFLNWTEIEEDV